MLRIELDFGTHDQPATFGHLRKFVKATDHYRDDAELPIAVSENLEPYGLYGFLQEEGDNGGT